MIEVNQIYNEHCFETMNAMKKNSIDIIITSPFYNTNAKAKGNQTLRNCCEWANNRIAKLDNTLGEFMNEFVS